MQRRHVNGPSHPSSLKNSKPVNKSKVIGLHENGTVTQTNVTAENDLQSYDDEDLDIAPYVVRKDRLIMELESSLAEIDDQCVSASRLEEQKNAAEEQRNVLLREIEGTVSEIQSHVLNAREMEIEKKAIENECKGLKKQVEHLRALLDGKEGNKQWNHIDILHGDDSMRASLAHANSKNQLLEKEVKKLRLANERLHLKEKSSKGSADVEKLRKENEELQKLLQAAEESENNIAQELATCHQTMAQMKHDYEQLNQEKLHIEAEKNSIALEKAELESELKKLHDSQDKQNANAIKKDSGVPSSRLEKEKIMLQKKLQKNEDEREELENQNTEQKKRIEELQAEIKGLKQGKKGEKGESKANEQLRPALEKLNKENSELHLELEKAEKEINALKICLEEEHDSKTNEDVAIEKNEKTKAETTKKGKTAKKTKKSSTKEDKKSDENDEDMQSLKDEIEMLKKNKFNMESECLALSETVTKVAGEKRTMKKEIEDLTNEKEKLEKKVKDLEFRIRELEIIKARKEELDTNHAELQTRHQEVSSELEKVNENNAMIHNQLERATAEKDTLLTERKEFQEALQAIKKEMEGVRKDVASKSNEIKLLRKKHEEEKRRLIGMKDGGDKEMNRLQNKLKGIGELLGMETDLEPDEEEVKKIIKKLQTDVEELKKKNEELEKSKIDIEEKLEGVEKKSEELLVESAKANDMAMEKAVELSRTKRAYEKKIEKLNKENSEFRKKLGELSPARSASPRISPEPIMAQNAQSVESEYTGASSAQPHPLQPSQASKHGNSGPRHQNLEGRRSPPYTGRGHGLPIEPPPYPMTKRKSMDDVALRDQRNERYLPPYPGRPRRTSETRPTSRPQSGSVVTVVAGSVGDRQEVRRSNANYSSFPKERRRSHGGQAYPQRSSEPGHSSEPQSPSEPTFQVVGYRKVIQEHYV
ncbi:coiled-coil domain-containing protein 158-like [Actinia tenebrosa]|uniref:Coiled-coil domain-containing protein 158-like n=1 Tax=Actinia tenebrosa TaxID=6105 RepID=A0A6P8HCX1_ACTTE|nr:coiled-coil domain-containing protein 158-like [Actinia tenebrosa]